MGQARNANKVSAIARRLRERFSVECIARKSIKKEYRMEIRVEKEGKYR